MFVRLMLKYFGDKLSESGECSFNVAGHGEVDFMFLVVPIKCDAKIPSSFPVFFNFVVLLKCLDEVVDISFVNVFNTKTVHNQCEADGSPVMSPVPWRDFALAVSGLVKSLGEEVLRNDAGLRQAVHSLSHFTENISVCIHLVAESIFLNDIGWE